MSGTFASSLRSLPGEILDADDVNKVIVRYGDVIVDMTQNSTREQLIGRRVKTTIPMGNAISWLIAEESGNDFTPDEPGMEGNIAWSYGHYDKRLIVEFDDGEWADYEPEKFEFVE